MRNLKHILNLRIERENETEIKLKQHISEKLQHIDHCVKMGAMDIVFKETAKLNEMLGHLNMVLFNREEYKDLISILEEEN